MGMNAFDFTGLMGPTAGGKKKRMNFVTLHGVKSEDDEGRGPGPGCVGGHHLHRHMLRPLVFNQSAETEFVLVKVTTFSLSEEKSLLLFS